MINKFDIFNDMKVDFNKYEEVILTPKDISKISSRLHKKIHSSKNSFKRSAIIVASLLVLVITSSLLVPNADVFAKINILGMKLENFFGKSPNSLDAYKKQVNQSVLSKGITLFLNETTIDDGQLLTNISLDYSKFNKKDLGIKYTGSLQIIPRGTIKLFMGGKEMVENSSGQQYVYNSEYTTNILSHINYNDMNLDKSYTAKYICDKMEIQIPNGSPIIIDGNWNLDFKIDCKAIKNSTKVIPLNRDLILTDAGTNLSVYIKEIRNSPFSLKFKYQYDLSTLSQEKSIQFKLLDEHGTEIPSNYGNGSGNLFSSEYLLAKGITKIKIVPGIFDSKVGWKKIKFFYDRAIDIDLTK